MTDESLDSGRRGARLFVAGLLAATALSLALNFYRLGAGGLKNPDEAIEAITSREMLQAGDWLTPHLNGIPRYTKPPLYFWLTAAAFRVLGQTDFALRFWSAAAGTGAVVLTGLIGRRLFGDWAGVFAALALATSARFIYFHGARNGCLDAMTTFWIAAGMLCIVDRGAHPRLLVGAGLAFGLASLTKNFMGLPAAGVAGIHLYATRRTSPRIPPRLIWCAAATLLLLSLAWPAAMLILHGRPFAAGFLLRENLDRFRPGGGGPLGLAALGRPLPRRVVYLARTLLDGFFPWSLLAPLMIPWALWRLPEWKRDDRALAVLWAALYAAGSLAIVNLLARYEYPLYPAVAILIGAFVQTLLPDGSRSTLLPAAAGALAAAALLFRPNWGGDGILMLAPTRSGPMLALALAAILVFLIHLRPRVGRTLLGSGLALVSAAFALAPLRSTGNLSPSKLLSTRLEAVAPEYGNAVTIWNVPFLAPTGDFAGGYCEARWYLFGMRGVTIRNRAEETALPEPLFRPRLPALVLTQADALGKLAPRKLEADVWIWRTHLVLAGLPGEP